MSREFSCGGAPAADLLRELGLTSWVKTSGSKGFHIVVPLDGAAGFVTSRGSRTGWRHAGERDPGASDAGVLQGRPARAHLVAYGIGKG